MKRCYYLLLLVACVLVVPGHAQTASGSISWEWDSNYVTLSPGTPYIEGTLGAVQLTGTSNLTSGSITIRAWANEARTVAATSALNVNIQSNGTLSYVLGWEKDTYGDTVWISQTGNAAGNGSATNGGTAGVIVASLSGEPPEEKGVRVVVMNYDDRPWVWRFPSSSMSGSSIQPGQSGVFEFTEDDLTAGGEYGLLETDRTYRELHEGGMFWDRTTGQWVDTSGPGGDGTYVWSIGFGPLGKSEARDPYNVITITIPRGTAKNQMVSALAVDATSWDPTPGPDPESPPNPSPAPRLPRPPLEEVSRVVNQYTEMRVDPLTGNVIRLQSTAGPITTATTPATNDAVAIIEALSEADARAEERAAMSILQMEALARSERLQHELVFGRGIEGLPSGEIPGGGGGGDDPTGMGGVIAAGYGGGIGGVGKAAGARGKEEGEKAGNLIPAPPSGTPWASSAGSKPNLAVTFPAAFGGAEVDFNPFREDRLGPIAGWFRTATAWLTLVLLGGWVWTQMGEWIRGFSTIRQATGNAVVGGTGAQGTALVAAGLITTAIVVAVTGLVAWGFGDITITTISTTVTTNPLAGMGAGALWMVDQLLPVATLLTALVARITFNMYAAGLFSTCAAVIRFIVP